MPVKFLTTFLGMFLVLAAWSLATPTGSSPDEFVHLQRMYCFTGEDLCPAKNDFVQMPIELISYESNCWRIPNFQIINSCDPKTNKSVFAQIERPFPGTYSSIYYKTMAFFYLGSAQTSVIFMRLFNSLLMAVVIAFSSHILRSQYKYNANLLIPLIPNIGYFVASVNPTSWSLTALYGLACSLVSFCLQGRNKLNMALFAFSSVFCFFSRPDTRYTFLIILMFASIVAIKKSEIPNCLKYLCIFLIAGLPFYLTLKQQLLQKHQLGSFSGLGNSRSIESILHNLLKTPQFINQMISPTSGSYASSFTALPFVLIANLLILYLLMISIRHSSSVVKLLIIGQILALIVLINIFHLIWGLRIGDSIQPRYFLPLFVVILIFTGLQSTSDISHKSYTLISTTAVLITLGSLHTTMRRWSVGLFEFSKTGLFSYTIDDKWNDIELVKMNSMESFKSLLFYNSKWEPNVVGGQWTVLLLAGIGGIILISTRGSLNSLVEEQSK